MQTENQTQSSVTTNPTVRNRYTNAVIYEGAAGMTTREMLEKATSSGADLYGASLCYANLSGADLRCANLSGADLRCADLRSANLYGADLYGADLYGADLRDANLRGADLSGANLYDANLYGADLYGADLRCANLSGADLRCANLYGASLGETYGKLQGERPFFQCGPIGSRSDYLQAFITDKGAVIKAGCFTGFLHEFVEAVEQTHGDSKYAKEYQMAVLMVESHVALWG